MILGRIDGPNPHLDAYEKAQREHLAKAQAVKDYKNAHINDRILEVLADRG